MKRRQRLVAAFASVFVLISSTAATSAGRPASSIPGIPGVPGNPVPKPTVPVLPKPAVPALPKLPPLPIPDITQLVNGEDAISTSLADAVTSIPFLNDYQPFASSRIPPAMRAKDGRFDLMAGSYVFENRSYCLHPGKYFAVKGSGYLLAPLKGSKAEIIRTILVRSADDLEIPQREVQQLIWAVLARMRIADLSPQLQADAAKLLTPTQILLLSGSAIGVVPQDKLAGVLSKIPDPLKPVVQAENSLRGLLASNASYDAMEQVAVPGGTQEKQNLPHVRWSFAPQGYFIWYVPHGYPWTTTFVDVPGAVTMRQDSMGRVALLRDRLGNSVEISYGSSASDAAPVSGDAGVRFDRIRSVRFAWQQTIGGKSRLQTETWPTQEWVMVGVPDGKGRPSGAAEGGNWRALYAAGDALRSQFQGLVLRAHGDVQALSSLVALGELRGTLKKISGGHSNHSAVIDEELNFPVGAWESVFARSVGGHTAANVDAGRDDPVDIPNGVAQPQDPGAQRLGQSQEPPCQLPPGTGNHSQQVVAKGLSDGGYPNAGSNPQLISYSDVNESTVDWYVDLDKAGNPINPCEPGTPQYTISGTLQRSGDNWDATTDIWRNGNKIAGASGSAPSPCASCAIANALKQIHY